MKIVRWALGITSVGVLAFVIAWNQRWCPKNPDGTIPVVGMPACCLTTWQVRLHIFPRFDTNPFCTGYWWMKPDDWGESPGWNIIIR